MACLVVQTPLFIVAEELAMPSAVIAWVLVGGRYDRCYIPVSMMARMTSLLNFFFLIPFYLQYLIFLLSFFSTFKKLFICFSSFKFLFYVVFITFAGGCSLLLARTECHRGV